VIEHEHVQRSVHKDYANRIEPHIESVKSNDVVEAEHIGARVISKQSIYYTKLGSHNESMKDKDVLEERYIGELVKGEQSITKVFSKQLIPDEEENPRLRAYLIHLWDQRQATAVAMNESLSNDDMPEYAFHQGMFNSINHEMHNALVDSQHEIHSTLVDDLLNRPVGTEVTQTSSSVSTPSSPPDRGTTPRDGGSGPYFPDHGQSQPKPLKWRNVDSLRSTGHPVINNGLKMSYKEDTCVFDIFLSYQGIEVSRTVNENLPLRILFTLAKSYLETDFYFSLTSDHDLDLRFDGQLLQRSGILADVPIYDGAVVGVLYPIKPPMSGESPSHPTPKGSGRKSVGYHHQESEIHQSPPRGLQKDGLDLYDKSPVNSLDPKSYDKIRQNFKCPKFTGQARDWKLWDKGFWRYLSIWELDYVLDPSFFDVMPLSAEKRRDNKLVYYVIEDSVQNSTLAVSYVRKASLNNGFEAYYTLHDGYVFAGATTATLLLAELSGFRFLPDESPTELCLRLDELFQELRDLPGDAAVTFIDTQKVGYLVNALRHEKEWDYVCSAITSAQIKGGYTFIEACNELKVRCEVSRANDLLDKPVKGRRVKGLVTQPKASDAGDSMDPELSAQVLSLISSYSKKLNIDQPADNEKKNRRKRPLVPCLAVGCKEQTAFPLCPLHYHSLLSGKTASVPLQHGYGNATYDTTSQFVVYPAKVPDDRLSAKQIAARKPQQVAANVATKVTV
jgi:hypothetical protein